MKTVKKLTHTLFLFFITGFLFLAFSAPVLAYEEDTHFQMTYVICRSVGFTHDEALIVAAVDQGMDDSDGVVANYGPIPWPNSEWKWHALDENGHKKAAGIIARRDTFFDLALNEPGYYNKLIRLGVFFHFQQDIWGHRHHYKIDVKSGTLTGDYDPSHLSATNFLPYATPWGHAFDGFAADRPPFDPPAALNNLQEGIQFANIFLSQALYRERGRFLGFYTPKDGENDSAWQSKEKSNKAGKFFHQLSYADVADPWNKPDNTARGYLISLIRAQIDVYDTSMSPDPIYTGHFTPDKASLREMKIALESVWGRYQPYRPAGATRPATIDIPDIYEKKAAGFTTITTAFLEQEILPQTAAITEGTVFELPSHIPANPGNLTKTYLVFEGKLREVTFVTEDLYGGATKANQLPTPVKIQSLDKYPVGETFKNNTVYMAQMAGGQSKFLIVDGKRRLFMSPQAIARYGFRPKLRTLSKESLLKIPDGPNIVNPGYSFIGKDATTITTRSSDTYLIFDQQLHLVPNGDVHFRLFNIAEPGLRVRSADGYLTGSPLSNDAYLAKAPGSSAVYLVTGSWKRKLGPKAYETFEFGRNTAKVVTQAELDKISTGADIP